MEMKSYSKPIKRNPADFFKLIFSGFCMGCADIIPGVSGGTIAFILGIYEEIIQSIRSFIHKEVFVSIVTFRFLKTWKLINGAFLLSVGLGIILAILTLSHTIEMLLTEYPTYIWSLFFGLVLASVFIVSRRIKKWKLRLVAGLILGTVAAYLIVGMVPVQTPETWWFILFSGAIAICAMILPGVSGSFLLVLLGKYEFVLHAVNERDIKSIGIFFIGAVAGLIIFSQILGWLLRRFHDITIVVLIGFMLGSLRRIWPWKATENGVELMQKNALPQFVQDGTLLVESFVILGLMGIGVILVLLLERFAASRRSY